MKNRIICLVSILLLSGFAEGQVMPNMVDSLVDDIKEQVKKTDGLTLYKLFLTDEGFKENMGASYSRETFFELYFDEEGLLKKLCYTYVLDYSHCVMYFDRTGVAIYTRYFSDSMLGSYSTERYLDCECELLYVDHICRDDTRLPGAVDDVIIERIIRRGRSRSEIPEIHDEIVYNDVLSVDDFKRYFTHYFDYDGGVLYGGEFPELPAELKFPVVFTSPVKGEVTSLIRNGVPLYEKPKSDSRIMHMLDIREDIRIISGKGGWYKVSLDRDEVEGYINSDVLAPVERAAPVNQS